VAMLVKEIVDCYLDKLRRDELTGGVEQFNCLLFVLQLPSICSRLEFPLYRDGELVLENVELYRNVPPQDIEEVKKKQEEANKVSGEHTEEVEASVKEAKRNKNNSKHKEPIPNDKALYLHWLEKHSSIASYVGQGAVNPQAFHIALYELRCSLTHVGASYMTSGRIEIVRFIGGYNETVTIGAELYIPFKLFCEQMLAEASGSLSCNNLQVSPFDSILVSADFLSTRYNSDYSKALPKFDSELPTWKRRKRKCLFELYRVLTNCLGFKVCIDKQGKLGIRILEFESKFENEKYFISNALITYSLTEAIGIESLRTLHHLCKAKGFEFIEGIQSKTGVDNNAGYINLPTVSNDGKLIYEKFPMCCCFKLHKSSYEEMISVMEDYLKFLTKLKEEFNEDFRA